MGPVTGGLADSDRRPGSPVSSAPRTPGRRSGPSTTREEILAAARAQFAVRGFEGASLRAIAKEADVDAGLIAYFFGSKQGLFREALALPFDPQVVLPAILEGDREQVGERLARLVATTLEDPDARSRLLGLLRSASVGNQAAEMIRRRVTEELLEPIAAQLGVEDAAFRAGLAFSQIVGMTTARHLVGIEVLAQASSESLVQALAPTLQRYLTGAL